MQTISDRFDQLVKRGDELVAKMPRDRDGELHNIFRGDGVADFHGWLTAVANLINTVAPAGSFYIEECDRLFGHKWMETGMPSQVVLKMHGLLRSAREDWHGGLLRRIEYIVVAAAFDDFLDHAAYYHKGNKKVEAAVLGSAVLEDTIKRIASRHSVATDGRSLEQLIEALVAADVFTPVKAKRVKGYAGVRNHALHAEWDKFDIRDAGELISGTRELLETYLS